MKTSPARQALRALTLLALAHASATLRLTSSALPETRLKFGAAAAKAAIARRRREPTFRVQAIARADHKDWPFACAHGELVHIPRDGSFGFRAPAGVCFALNEAAARRIALLPHVWASPAGIVAPGRTLADVQAFLERLSSL